MDIDVGIDMYIDIDMYTHIHIYIYIDMSTHTDTPQVLISDFSPRPSTTSLPATEKSKTSEPLADPLALPLKSP